MCELFGVSSTKKIRCNDMLEEFFSHADTNPHGWGIATFYENTVSVEKEPVSAIESVYLKNRLTVDIMEDRLLAHIRRASKGQVEYKNTHPFFMRDNSGRLWTLIHNGNIFESAELTTYTYLQPGNTDSERILYYLVDMINRKTAEVGSPLTDMERFDVVEEVIKVITPENKVNLIIDDGELFYVHTNQKGTLHRYQSGKSLAVSTKPLSKGRWEEIPINILYAYKKGILQYTGEKHGNEYIQDEKKERELFLDDAQL